MGLAMEIISGFATNPGSTFTQLTMSGSDSASVRNFPNTDRAYIFDQWAAGGTGGFIRTVSPRLHDNVAGITLGRETITLSLLTGYERELLYPQDTLGLYITGGGAEVDAFSTLMYYENLPGTAARLYNWNEIMPRILHLSGVSVAVTSGGTAGEYSGAVAINATQDQFKANTDYAILGYLTETEFCTIGVRSSDFGNLRVGGPGSNIAIETRDWFVRLNKDIGQPAIPVFNAANKQNTIVDVLDVNTATSATLTFICAELSTPGGQVA